MLRLAGDLDQHLRGGGTLLVPSRARARAVQLAYATARCAEGARVWASPDVLTPAGWRRREAERCAAREPAAWPRLLTPAEEWLLWRQSTEEAAGQIELLDRGALATALQRASELAAEYGLALPPAPGESEAGLLYEVQRLFRARCAALGAASISELLPRLHAEGRLLLRGFSHLTPALAALASEPEKSGARPPELAGARRVHPQDPEGELEAISAWCSAHLVRDAAARLLVILPGADGPRERLAAHLRFSLEPQGLVGDHPERSAAVAIEGAAPLSHQSLPGHALRALELLAGTRAEFDTWARWLRSPQWETPEASIRAALVQALRTRRRVALDLRELLPLLRGVPRELRAGARELDFRLRSAAAPLSCTRAAPRAWAERCKAALAQLGWPGALRLDAHAQPMLMRWHELLEEFGALSGSVPLLERTEALGLLRELAGRTPYRPTEGDPSISIAMRLADPIVGYDGIWVANASMDVLPEPLQPDAFLPLSLQLRAGVAGASTAGRSAEAQAHLAALGAATPELVFSVPAMVQDLAILPSPLIAHLPERAAARSPWPALQLHRAGLTETLTDANGLPWDATQSLPGGTHALVLQNQCPFRSYAQLRLGAIEPKRAEPGIAHDERGQLLHAALEILWGELRDSARLGALSPGALDELIGRSVTQAAQAQQARTVAPHRRRRAQGQYDLFASLPPALLRECARAQRLIRRLCELERTRAPFVVTQTEQSREVQLAGARLRLCPDRIDRTAQGLIVLDYKSGRRVGTDWLSERPTHAQLLAYVAALGEEVAALALVQLRPEGVRFRGLAREEKMLPKVPALEGAAAPGVAWQAQQARWRAHLTQLITAFLSGDARLDPLPGACTHCHVIDLCRIRERGDPPQAAQARDD